MSSNTSLIMSAMAAISCSFMPRVVTAGVPNRTPLAWNGERVSNGIVFLFTVMPDSSRSEEHTSELQSRSDLVCRLLLEKKKKRKNIRLSSSHDSSSYGVFDLKQNQQPPGIRSLAPVIDASAYTAITRSSNRAFETISSLPIELVTL